MAMDVRPQRALQIAQAGDVKLVGENTFNVKSQSKEGSYLVSKMGGDWTCECLDFIERRTPCKHIYACSFYPSLKQKAAPAPKPTILAESITPNACVYCKSESIVKRGFFFIQEKGRKIQRYWCKACNKTFVSDLGFKKMKNDSKAITAALDAYFRGLSLRDVKAHLEQFYGVSVNATTILRWVQKYSKVISQYVNTLSPQLSETWHADEVFVKMRGAQTYKTKTGTQTNLAFLWNIMDRKTRFLLTSKLSKARDVGGAARAFTDAAKVAHDSEPERVFTDGLTAYNEGLTFAPFTKDPEHIANVGIKKPHATNNRIERLNGTVRERTKIQRGWKTMNTSIPEGHRIFYNFVRPHMALGEQTPAQAAGIDLGLEGNKWMELITKANAQKTQQARVSASDAQSKQ